MVYARDSKWTYDLNLGSPANDLSVKEYHSLVLEEQAMARALPS